ncbi:MAG: tetratricopeptide repeat protein [Candidatus Asgardarchaeia archaeon]
MKNISTEIKRLIEKITRGDFKNIDKEINALEYKLPSNHPIRLFLNSLLEMKQGKFFEAYKRIINLEKRSKKIALELAKKLNINDSEIWNELGEIYSSFLSDPIAAEECYLESIKCNPDSVLPYIGLAFLYDDLKEPDKVKGVISTLLEDHKIKKVYEKVWVYILLGTIEEKYSKESRKARENLRIAINIGEKIEPNAKLAMILGAIALKLGYIKKAKKFLEKAITKDPQNQYAWGLLAIINKIEGNFNKLLECIDKVVENEIEPAEVWIDLILRYTLPVTKIEK